MAADAANNDKDLKWGDFEDEDFLGDEQRYESPIDDKGIKTITDIQVRDGKKFKVIKKVRVVKRSVKVNKRAEERLRTWVPFGKGKENGIDITVREVAVPFDISGKRKPVQSIVEKKIDEEIMKMMRQSSKPTGPVVDADAKYVPRSLRPGGRTAAPEPARAPEAASNVYRPPGVRDGRVGAQSMAGPQDDAFTIRVSNLSDDITEQDLRDLFEKYGRLLRVFMPKDRITRETKDFAFVKYARREDAEKAIEKTTGFRHNHRVWQVEWARPANN